MDKLITQDQINEIATNTEIDSACLKAVIAVESSGHGFAKDGRIMIQFEPYHFKRYTGVKIANGVEIQSNEWRAYMEANEINSEAAMLSTSWGMGQIMGFNFKACGFTNVQDMVEAFTESEYNQVKGMVEFIKSNHKMFAGLQSKDWNTVAFYYNGAQYEQFNYAERLKTAYEKCQA